MCWKCGNSTDLTSVSRSDVCPVCNADIRSCKNCVFYAPGNHYDCRETIQDLVTDKEKANFCDYFKLNKNGSGKSDYAEKAAKARAAAEALFS